jgi:hypothetical protein
MAGGRDILDLNVSFHVEGLNCVSVYLLVRMSLCECVCVFVCVCRFVCMSMYVYLLVCVMLIQPLCDTVWPFRWAMYGLSFP